MSIWYTLEHNGVCLSNKYKSHCRPVYYDDKPYYVSITAEEILSAVVNKKDLLNDKTFYKNFHKSIKRYLPKDLKQIDLKELVLKDWKPYAYTFEPFRLDLRINGKSYQSQGSLVVEPPHIFVGRGDHPLRGTFKHRINEKDITLNLSNHFFQKFSLRDFDLVENKNVSWYASWRDSITNESRYLYLPKTFHSNDSEKFDLARLLKKRLPIISLNNKNYLNHKDSKVSQCAVCVYLIYKLCIRVGNEKDTNIDSDTIGCCSICKEHVTLLKDRKVTFKFIGKDSIPFKRTITMDPLFYTKLEEYCSKASKEIFTDINPGILNRYLNKLLPNLTAKVFRTMKASTVFQSNLENTMNSFRTANKKAAYVCNHTNNTTSKNNYIDPRIIYNFSNKTKIPIEKLMSNECIKKHGWAKHTNTNFVF